MNTTPKTSRSTSDTLSLPALKGGVSRVKSMTNEVINNSYYSKSNTQNKVSIGVIDVNITDTINVKLNLDDISVLNTIMGVDFF